MVSFRGQHRNMLPSFFITKKEKIKMDIPKEYYPTPDDLIDKMISKVDFKYVENFLEPSAGDGRVADKIQEKYSKYYWRQEKKASIDCVEKDKNLRYILSGKGYHVVGDDFLTFNTYKLYDAQIMNPPYSNGDQHLLKALEMQKYGGQIVCLLNAQTLKNPNSCSRQELLQKLKMYNADIEYITGAFETAERKTDVEIAMVYVNIPYTTKNSIILENLKKTQPAVTHIPEEFANLAKKDILPSLVDQFNLEVRTGTQLIDEFNSLSPMLLDAFPVKDNKTGKMKNAGGEILSLNIGKEYATINSFLEEVRYKYWYTLLQTEKFRNLFTENLRQEYMSKINELKNYDFSLSNIYQILINVNSSMMKSLDETILSLFDELSYQHSCDKAGNIHYYNGWKTNKSYIINKKVIMPINGWDDIWNKWNYSYYNIISRLRDVEKIFCYLDPSKGTASDNIPEIEQVLKEADNNQQSSKIHTQYFDITFYKKGTAHIEFTNHELLKKFNIFGSQHKGWLPPTYGKVRYNDLTEEEKTVIDSFEGKDAYNDTIANAPYYLGGAMTPLLMGSETQLAG